MNQAIEKIKTGMDAQKAEPFVQIIGNFLLQYLETHPEQAEKFMHPDKTLEKSVKVLYEEAKKRRTGQNVFRQYAFIPDQEAYAIILSYFGINGQQPALLPAPEQPARRKFNYSVDDFLGGGSDE